MHTYFHGWRRKAGVAMLVMALALFVTWGRSQIIYDGFVILMSDMRYDINSDRSRFSFEWGREEEPSTLFTWWVTDTYKNWDIRLLGFLDDDAKTAFAWRLDLVGCSIGTCSPHRANPFERSFVVVSYWVAVLPLTLLSAYLILWKPRKRPSPN
ncbi:MAG: hypothetical protein JWP89_568 [Schlesneria sp.]|nr:hypothetical protein [Schlesneria sp.]